MKLRILKYLAIHIFRGFKLNLNPKYYLVNQTILSSVFLGTSIVKELGLSHISLLTVNT